MYGKFGKQHPNSKKIIQYTLQHKFIKEWDCARDITNEIGICYKNISSCCRGKSKTAGGFIFKFK